jgi:hypothetical protein
VINRVLVADTADAAADADCCGESPRAVKDVAAGANCGDRTTGA